MMITFHIANENDSSRRPAKKMHVKTTAFFSLPVCCFFLFCKRYQCTTARLPRFQSFTQRISRVAVIQADFFSLPSPPFPSRKENKHEDAKTRKKSYLKFGATGHVHCRVPLNNHKNSNGIILNMMDAVVHDPYNVHPLSYHYHCRRWKSLHFWRQLSPVAVVGASRKYALVCGSHSFQSKSIKYLHIRSPLITLCCPREAQEANRSETR